jgi:hypothetical protein
MTGPVRAIPKIPVLGCRHMAEHAQASAPRAVPKPLSVQALLAAAGSGWTPRSASAAAMSDR